MIKLKMTADRRYRGTMNYLVVYDHSSGRRGRFCLLILNAGDPVVAGREVTLNDCKKLIAELEEEANKRGFFFIGSRAQAQKCLDGVLLRMGFVRED